MTESNGSTQMLPLVHDGANGLRSRILQLYAPLLMRHIERVREAEPFESYQFAVRAASRAAFVAVALMHHPNDDLDEAYAHAEVIMVSLLDGEEAVARRALVELCELMRFWLAERDYTGPPFF